jgi:formate dehydrogenase (coenzyme F420) beta subunit
MTAHTLAVKEGHVNEAVNDFLKHLLSSKKVSALLVPQATPAKKTPFPVLITDPKKLHADIIAPVMPSSTAKIISKMTKVQASQKPLGVVIRSCQAKALIELAKLNQARLDNLILIGVDCLGTFTLKTYGNFPEKQAPTKYLIESFSKKTGDADKYLRTSCRVCQDLVPINTDVTIGLYGMDIEKELLVEANTDAGKALLEELKLPSHESKNRDKAVKELMEAQAKKHADFLKDKASIQGIDALAEFFENCVNCHNCRTTCPICYCKECLYDSAVFDQEAYKYVRKAENKGLYKMPNDSVLFQIGRMNHMILSCVQCGLCEQACPNDIPLMDLFIRVADKAQKTFDYHPGKKKDEKVPLAVYREDEFTEVGEK